MHNFAQSCFVMDSASYGDAYGTGTGTSTLPYGYYTVYICQYFILALISVKSKVKIMYEETET
jgi:hypothetical protein